MTTRPAPAATHPHHGSRDFGLLWCGEGASLLGSMTTALVLPLLAATVLDATPMWMGMLTAATWVPWLVIGLHAGALVDRSDPRRPMIAADLLAAATLVAVPVADTLGVLSLAQVVLTALVVGASGLVVRTGMASLLPRLVPRERLDTANSRIYGTESAAQTAGPALGGVLVQLLGAGGALVLDAASTLVSAACLWRITPQPRGRGTEGEGTPPGGAVLGLRALWSDRYLRYTAVTGGLSNGGLIGYQAILVLFLVRDLGLGPAGVGLFQAIGAAGGLLGAAVAPALGRRLGPSRAMVALGVLAGPPAQLIPCAGPGWRAWLVPAGAALVGLGVVGANVLRSGFRVRRVPPDLLGRVAGATGIVNMGVMPVASLLAGWAGSRYGLVPTMAAFAAVHTLTALPLLTPLSPFGLRRDYPTEQMAVPGA